MKVKTKVKGGTLTIDEDGFITNPDKWEEPAARS
jgi:sulfur relay (sulfurtransferase) DsrC/TusE family protein